MSRSLNFYAVCAYAECQYAECDYPEWHYGDCRLDECHDYLNVMLSVLMLSVEIT